MYNILSVVDIIPKNMLLQLSFGAWWSWSQDFVSFAVWTWPNHPVSCGWTSASSLGLDSEKLEPGLGHPPRENDVSQTEPLGRTETARGYLMVTQNSLSSAPSFSPFSVIVLVTELAPTPRSPWHLGLVLWQSLSQWSDTSGPRLCGSHVSLCGLSLPFGCTLIMSTVPHPGADRATGQTALRSLSHVMERSRCSGSLPKASA